MNVNAKLLFPESRGIAGRILVGLVLMAAVTGTAFAQTPTATDDAYAAASGFLLQVEAPGVMENDHDGGGEPPPSPTAVVHLASDVSFGVLVLNGDGSFDYTSNVGYAGVDTFTYYFVDGTATSNTATVTLTVDGCQPGVAPTQWVCWVEQAYLAKAAELGLSTFVEGFEDDVTWAAAREPATTPTVISQGITWASNLATNNVATGDGPQHSGGFGFFSLPHGDLVGAPGDRTRDGFTGTASSPSSLLGVGGWLVSSQVGARIDYIITYDGGATTTPGFPDHNLTFIHEFFGFIDTAGFTSFEVVETDGTVNQPFFIFGDDFSIVSSGTDTASPQVVEIGSWEETADGVISESEVVNVDITELMVRFSEAVQDLPGDTSPDDVTNPDNYLLFDDGGDGFDTVSCAGGVVTGDNAIAVDVWQYLSGEPSETWLGVNGGVALPSGTYRLLVCGTTSIIDWAGNVLDGDANGTGGDDFVLNFMVPVNNPPTATPQSVSTPEDTALGILLTGSDPDGDSITFAIGTGPLHGVLTGAPPNVTYTPGSNYHGPDSFTFTTNDGSLTSLPATVSITVTPVNDRPTADDQAVSTVEDMAQAITLTGGDIDGDGLSFAIGTGPTHGALTGTPPDVTYTPTANYNGPDSFTFTASDGALTSLPATVSITVTPVNDTPLAADDSATTDEDASISIAVLTNDALGDEPTTITAVTQGASGSVAIDPGATTVTYTPDLNVHGADSFTYTITDADLETSTATVSMTVNPVNDTPLAVDDGATTDEDTAISIAVLTNDALGDEPTTITSVTQGTSGAVTIDPGATSVTYTPNLNTNGPDSFSYTITDLDFETSIATVSMTIDPINDAPVADAGPDQTVFVTDTVTLDGSGSSDVDGDPLTHAWTFSSVPAGSTASLSDPTAVMPTFVVDLPGDYVVELIVRDGTVFSAPDTVTISTTNSAPVADAGPDQSALVTDTVTLDGSGSSDADNDPLTFAWTFSSVPAGSTASLSDPTAVMPTFVIDLPGAYVVELIVRDGTVFSAPDTVTISTDNSAPVADAGPDQTALVTDTVILDGSGSSDADNDPLTFAWTFSSVPAGSTASLSDPIAIDPTFVIDLPGDYIVQLIVSDGTVFSTPDTVLISTSNSAPVADPQSVSTPEDTALGILLTGSDADGDPITFEVVTGPTHGALTGVLPNLVYTPVANTNGPDSFTFRAWDGSVWGDPATVAIDVLPVNDPPTADDQSVSTPEDTALLITLTGGDIDGDAVSFVLGAEPSHGVLTNAPPNVTYTPDPDYHGPDSFSFTTTDGVLSSLPATVSITVTPVNDIPLAVDDSATTDEDIAISIAVLTNDDLGDEPTTITSVTQGTSGAVTIDPGATSVTYTPNLNTNGPDSFSYTITDLDFETSIATVSMTIDPINDAPVADPQSVSTPEDTALGILLTGSDADGDPITFEVVTGPTHGALTGDLPNLTYTPDVGYNGPDAFEFRAFDGLLYSLPATIAIDVTPVADPVLTIDDASIVEPDTGTATVTLAIHVSEPSPVSISVDFATADGSAVANLDYVEDSGTLTIPALSTSYDLTVEIIGDLVFEPEETFFVNLSNPVGATLGAASTATVTISDNDPWIWYVATDGDDANDCLSIVTACETISEAVSRAAAGDLIKVARGVYFEHLVLGLDLTLEGELPKGTVIDGGGAGIVIDISPAVAVIVRGFEIRNGAGGGIANQGDLTLEDSWVHDNGDGSTSTFGGLSNLGTALIDRVAITTNHGHTAGGVSNTGQLEIRNSTISGNSAGHAPGIDNIAGATLELVYSTVAANGSHGIRVGGGASLRGTIIAGHTAANCDAAVNTLGHNLEDADTCGLQTGSNDLIGTDPLLAPLGFHGGSSPTHAIEEGSPAVDAGESTGAPATDQRGVIRPIDGDLDGSATSDVGAFEFVPGRLFTDGFESGDTSAWN